ncbi:MAG TPA: hypothetical protein VJU16_01885 [Planctomycetota bacterium]|nr:hypothetical protein [Planctomycetota bacterium]
MNRLPPKAQARYVSTTMAPDRTIKERWINGFKLAFFASVLFGLVGLPFHFAEEFITWVVKGGEEGMTCAIWLSYVAVALLLYPILFDGLASVFRIQFVRKSIRLPVKAPALSPAGSLPKPPGDAPPA